MRNKQKAWRSAAAKLKQQAVKEGLHYRGVRYGKGVKALHVKVQPFVTPLFMGLMARASGHMGVQPVEV